MKIGELYDAYAAMEQLPVDARAAAAIAAKQRSDALARVDKRASNAKQTAEAAKAKLQAELRAEAQAASSRGAIPKSGTEASGLQPNFSKVRSIRQKVDGLIVDKTRADKDLNRFRSDLHALEQQIEDELRAKGAWARGQRADAITYWVGGLGVLLSIICGPALLGVTILVVVLAIVACRLWGPSAMMMRATQKRPALGSHRKSRLGYILSSCGWAGIASLILNLMLSRVLSPPGAGLGFEESSGQGLDPLWVAGMLCVIAAVVVGNRLRRGM
ncbi:hypothetical protein [Arthrobacter sp. OY3WO11]|uniref:hypothetical protein n=1 Tax=Arthrobacter sp. OY3WO11 TaxID=1835723 RepID=UPI0007CFAB16|nr:hypothetical protein [Arthrobacter sp. OY3WO11]OAD97734.1 hypothetical protein A6A22_20235 [Arthrobacter sp. OY3WO11]